MGELKKRIITGLFLAPVIAFLFYILPPVWFMLFLAAVGSAAVIEAASLARLPMRYLIAALAVAGFAPLYFRFFQVYMFWVLACVSILIVIAVLGRSDSVEEANRKLVGNVSAMLFVNFFIVLPFFYIYALKELDRIFPLILLFAIWASDTGAFIVGKKLGRHPLAPRISPKKTVEGLFGAVIGSMAVIAASHQLLGLTLAKALVAGAATGALGQAGDLLESSCKRVFDTKDSSSLIPGHGGILDRTDSFLFTAPFLYIFLVWIA